MFSLRSLFDRSFLSGRFALALGAGRAVAPPRRLRSHGLDLVPVGARTRRHGGPRPRTVTTTVMTHRPRGRTWAKSGGALREARR